jgi:hypothetical protein
MTAPTGSRSWCSRPTSSSAAHMTSLRSSDIKGALIPPFLLAELPGFEPNCVDAARRISDPSPNHMRSPSGTAAPISRFRRARAQEDETILPVGSDQRRIRLSPWIRGG